MKFLVIRPKKKKKDWLLLKGTAGGEDILKGGCSSLTLQKQVRTMQSNCYKNEQDDSSQGNSVSYFKQKMHKLEKQDKS